MLNVKRLKGINKRLLAEACGVDEYTLHRWMQEPKLDERKGKIIERGLTEVEYLQSLKE